MNARPHPAPQSHPGGPVVAATPASARRRSLRRLAGWAVLLGVAGAVAGLVFLSITGVGETWYGEVGSGFFEGHLWWVAVAAAAGLVVGLLRRALAVPDDIPGLVEDLKSEHIDTAMVPRIVAVSAVSLIGGASLGPEVALGQIGGGSGAVLARRAAADGEATKEATLTGMSGAFGGLFSSPLMATILVLEIARPAKNRSSHSFYGSLLASAVSFGLYFAVAGTVFLGLYEVPQYEYQDWHLLAGVGLGLLAALVVLMSAVIVLGVQRIVARLRISGVLLATLGGLGFGLVGFALPLTNFTGTEQLNAVLDQAGTLGIGLLVAILLGKMLTFAVSTATGFIGGPIFPMIFIGGTSGVVVHHVVPDVPLGLAFTCMLAAVPGALVAAPFSLVLLTALLTQVGAIQTAPIALAVATSFLTFSTLKSRVAERHRARSAGAGQAPSPAPGAGSA